MKKNKLLIGLLMIFIALGGNLFAANNQNDIAKLKKLSIFHNPNINITAYGENESTFQVKGFVKNSNGRTSPFEAFITKDLKEVIFGRGFSANNGKQLILPINTKSFLDKEAYAVGNGKDQFLLFTDPECPFCQKFEKEILKLTKNATFHVFLYPLSFHKHSKQMCYYILSQPKTKRAQVMHEIANGSNLYSSKVFSNKEIEKFEKILNEEIKIASQLGVSGTPTIYDTVGNNIPYPKLLQKYKIKQNVDMQGIEFLVKNNLGIKIAEKKTKPVFIFSSVETKKDLKKLDQTIKKYKKLNTIVLFLKIKVYPGNNKIDIKNLKYIYVNKTNEERIKVLNKILNGKKLDKATIKAVKEMPKKSETAFLPVSYIMQKMHLDAKKDIVVIDSNGKVLEEK